MQIEEALNYAIRTARRLTRDQESDSLAGSAAWYAYRTYDPKRGAALKTWVARCTTTFVRFWWRSERRRRQVQFEALTAEDAIPFEETIPAPTDSERLEIPLEDQQLLFEHHVERWPMDVLARRRGLSIRGITEKLRAAEARLARSL